MLGQFWYLWVIFGLLVIVTAVVIVFAARAVSSHNAETKKQLEELKRLKLLKDKYKGFDRKIIEEAEPFEVLEGACTVLQARIERAEDAEAEFAGFNDAQKYVYTLYYFLEDVEKEGLSFFFKNNGAELCSVIGDALKAVDYRSAEPPVNKLWAMFDEKNEEAEMDLEQLDDTDSQFLSTFDKTAFLSKVKEYIAANADELNRG